MRVITKKVSKITRKDPVEVYDLSVSKNRNFVISGTILHNCDYRGEVIATLWNTSALQVEIHRGDKIMQMFVQKMPTIDVEFVDKLDETKRGEGGFGSTGL